MPTLRPVEGTEMTGIVGASDERLLDEAVIGISRRGVELEYGAER